MGAGLCAIRVPDGSLCTNRDRLILIGERFFHKFFHSLEIIGDMYQYTEAFCHHIRDILRKQKKSSSLSFTQMGKKAGKYGSVMRLRLGRRLINLLPGTFSPPTD